MRELTVTISAICDNYVYHYLYINEDTYADQWGTVEKNSAFALGVTDENGEVADPLFLFIMGMVTDLTPQDVYKRQDLSGIMGDITRCECADNRPTCTCRPDDYCNVPCYNDGHFVLAQAPGPWAMSCLLYTSICV